MPIFNSVVLELQRLKYSKQITMQQFTDLIMRDQVLAGQILKAANSAFYGGLKQVTTLLGAVQRLGMGRVGTLAMLAAQMLAHKAKHKTIANYFPGLWQHSYISANGTQWLSQHVDVQVNPDEAFLCGLFHDIGRLFLLKTLDTFITQGLVPADLETSIIDDVLAIKHADIGYRLLCQWELPAIYAAIVRDHHSPNYDEDNQLLLMVRLMDQVCQKLGIGYPPQPAMILDNTPEARLLKITPTQLMTLEERLLDCLLELPLNLD
nr:HDOD domain-containing protein [Thiospirillum jenense]